MPTRIFLLKGVTSFPDPGNWTNLNKIECLGSGSSGAATYTAPHLTDEPSQLAPMPGAGGGGGGYGYDTGLTPTFPVTVNIAAKDQFNISNIPSVNNTYWNTISTTAGSGGVQGFCGAVVGGLGSAGLGGSFFPKGANGGNGGAGTGVAGDGGSGGGGAGGPNGAGTAGGLPYNWGPE
jgi:hypothetical protein